MNQPTARAEILLVDDRREDLTALVSVLAGPGYDLCTATSGADCLRRALERDFAVIVLDVVMPGIDGFEVASLLRGRPRTAHTPIIFLTGAGTDPGTIYRAYSVGAVDYLMKPVDADVLRAKVATFADLFRMDQRIRRQAELLIGSERHMRELEVAEIKLANERRYHNLADAIPQIVWTADPQGEVTYFNQRWAGYTGAAARGGGWLDAVHPDERGSSRQAWAEALACGEPFELECRLRGADGVYRWHLCRAVPERSRSGEIVGWLGTHTDFDEVVRAREGTEAARGRSELLAEASQLLASTQDVPAALARLARLVVLQIADACVIDVESLDVDGAPPPRQLAVAHRDPGRTAALEAWWRARDGLDAQRAEHAQLLREPGGAAVIVVPVVAGARSFGSLAIVGPPSGPSYDIADLVMAEDLGRRVGVALDNARLYARVEHAVSARDEFLSVASHELRTPLSALMLQLGGLERAVNGSDERIARKTAAALRHTYRMAKLVDSLLDVSRLATGRLALNVEDSDLAELVREVVERLADEASRAGCAIALRADAAVRGEWDRLRIEQVVTNLLANALKYGAGRSIELTVGGDRDRAWVAVRDHGIGIAADDLSRIFDRFERAAPAHHYGGLGLGLYIAREIVRTHGGTIRADSRPGEGATFTVELPRLRPGPADEPAAIALAASERE